MSDTHKNTPSEAMSGPKFSAEGLKKEIPLEPLEKDAIERALKQSAKERIEFYDKTRDQLTSLAKNIRKAKEGDNKTAEAQQLLQLEKAMETQLT